MADPIRRICFAQPSVIILTLALTLSAAGKPVCVIRNARVHTLSSAGTLEHASVVMENGKIVAIGSSVRVPPGARVIEGRRLEVYPGMVNAWSNVGLTEIPAVEVTNDAAEQGQYKPQLLAFSAIHPESEHIPVARVNGITSCLSVPEGGIIAGQSVLLHLDGWTVDEMAIRKSAGMVMTFPSLERPGGRYPGSGFGRTPRQTFSEIKRNYENQVKELSEWLEKARHYAKARQAQPATPADRQLEALVPVVEGKSIVFLTADTARDIRNAVEFGKKERLRFVIHGGREANQVADVLKKEDVPVILDSIVELPVREDDPYDARFTLPRELANAGVKFALTSPDSSEVRNLPYEAGFAEAYGVSHDQALRAVTLSPAEILGVADRLGSIEVGKVADLVVTDGDLLEIRTQVKSLFISGREVSLETKHTRLYEKYLGRP
jgi:imidazolonepropionase-like amidohydrolase